MSNDTSSPKQTTRREAIVRAGKFVLPTLITFSVGDLKVYASGTHNGNNGNNSNHGWGDGIGGGQDHPKKPKK